MSKKIKLTEKLVILADSLDSLRKLLERADVRSALNLTLATNYTNLNRLMQSEDIWKYWFYRDLEAVLDNIFTRSDGGIILTPKWLSNIAPLENVVEIFADRFIDKPVWKVLYLWYALLQAIAQFKITEKIPKKNVTFKELNYVIQSNEIVSFYDVYNPEELRSQLYPKIMHIDRKYVSTYFDRYLPSYEVLRLDEMFELLIDLSNNEEYGSFTQFPYAYAKKDKRFIVACSMCNSIKPQFKCGSCRKAYYCNEECQKMDYSRHKLDCVYLR